jgi:hypothetical protein
MRIFDILDKKTMEQCLEKAEKISHDDIMSIFEKAVGDLSKFTPEQCVSLAMVGMFLMRPREREEMKKRYLDKELEI